jgi:hypothetical protein
MPKTSPSPIFLHQTEVLSYFNSANGALLFDQDGNGIIKVVSTTTLNTGLALTNTSIFVES